MSAAPERMDAVVSPISSEHDAAAAYVTLGGTKASRRLRSQAVTRFRSQWGGLTGWAAAPLPIRLSAAPDIRALVAYLAVATNAAVDPDYVVRAKVSWGYWLAVAEPVLSVRFASTAAGLGWNDYETQRQWCTLAKLAVVSGRPARSLDRPGTEAARQALAGTIILQRGRLSNAFTTPLHGLSATLATLGILDRADGKRVPNRGRPGHWKRLEEQVPVMSATMRRYLAQLAVSMRPASVALIDTTLRHLASYLAEHHPEVIAVTEIRRTHIEGFKTWMNSRPGYRASAALAKSTIAMRISHLGGFFERIIEWDYDDAPVRSPVFRGDMPIRDRPLPRFLDDAEAAKLLSAARGLPGLFDRVCVEVLALTGLRKNEFLRLATDAVTVVGNRDWLHIPVGKLHTDRYIPLHPHVKELLGRWLAQRGDQPGALMFTQQGRPIPASRVDAAVRRAATAAGIGHVTPHQLRHTLATQAINRGMSLEAIAALLGHTSMSMTMTYARISDRTVADEYFSVTGRIEALYGPGQALPGGAGGPAKHCPLNENSHRMIGNGLCTRPVTLACHYETICESCAFFSTTVEFRDRLQAQRENAASYGEQEREAVYRALLDKLDVTAN